MLLDPNLNQYEALHAFMRGNPRLTHVTSRVVSGSLHGRRLVNVHIPKTAGTTLDRILNSIALRCGLGHFRALGTVYGQFMGDGKTEAADYLSNARADELSRTSIFSGHIPALAWGPAVGSRAAAYTALLRDPCERMLSQYSFGARRGRWDRSTRIETLVRSGQMADNLQVRMLAGCANGQVRCDEAMLEQAYSNLEARFSLIGVADRFDAFLSALLGLYGWPEIVYARYNVSAIPFQDEARAALREEAAQFNAFDIALVNRVRRHGDVWINQVDKAAPLPASRDLLVPLRTPGEYLYFPCDKIPELREVARQASCTISAA